MCRQAFLNEILKKKIIALPEEEVCRVSFCEEPGLFHLRAMAKELSRLLFNLREKQLALFPQRWGDAELS